MSSQVSVLPLGYALNTDVSSCIASLIKISPSGVNGICEQDEAVADSAIEGGAIKFLCEAVVRSSSFHNEVNTVLFNLATYPYVHHVIFPDY